MSGIVPRMERAVNKGTSRPIGQSRSSVDAQFTDSLDDPWSCWDRVPETVLASLARSGAIPRSLLISGAERPETRRQGDRHFQRAHAWAIGRDKAMLLRSERELQDLGAKRFRPASTWSADPEVWTIVADTARRRTGTVPADVARSDSAAGSVPTETSNLAENMLFLPEPVRKQLTRAVTDPDFQSAYFIQHLQDDRPQSQRIGCIRLTSQKVIAIRAERAFDSRDRHRDSAAMAQLPWQVTAYTANLTPVATGRVGPSARDPIRP